MPRATNLHSSSPTQSNRKPAKTTSTSSWHLLFFTLILPIALAAFLLWLDPFQPAHFPADVMSWRIITAPARNDKMSEGSEAMAEGHVEGPEDVVYDAATGVIYTGCVDGWIKRVTVKESAGDPAVESLVRTEGRPLGVALHLDGELIVADSDKGLMKVTRERKIELLTDEVEGLKFKLTDGVDVAEDGTIYFTDASYKYSFSESTFDMLEGKPHGRLVSYDPSTNHTTLLVPNLYFANGVAVSPDQQSVIFCETILRRCRKYYIKGPKKGSIEKFVENMPGYPDNIHYDGEGLYWIGLSSSATYSRELALRYPVLRKVLAVMVKYGVRPHVKKNGGVIAVDLEGKPIAHYYDAAFSLISSGIRIGNHLYCGSLRYPSIIRLDLNKFPALPTTKQHV
ncbi:protein STRICTOSIDINE SYNTHASE-LIKE 6-like [Neltuma alba]|uniref:protein STRICTOSIDINE SYNTHASE-LIKE 6-like n=1 Tax=Neltuma alba TaxID=207710 RepID=UPI0010A374FC|nr:protein STRICTOSIDINE SYNTHASE-LIKE 6-like [Prosopis alba]